MTSESRHRKHCDFHLDFSLIIWSKEVCSCHVLRLSSSPMERPWVVGSFVPTALSVGHHESNSLVSVKLSYDCSFGWHFDCNPERPLEQEASAKDLLEFSIYVNFKVNVCHFKPVSFGVICFAVLVDNEYSIFKISSVIIDLGEYY